MADKPRVNIRFLYCFVEDVKAVRRFYTDGLGMDERSLKDEERFGWINYQCDGFEFMFFRAEPGFSAPKDFAGQPGDGGGPLQIPSWSIHVPEESFRGVLERLKAMEVRAMTPAPTWRQNSYWGWTVLDPAGNTVELFFSPQQKPHSTQWQ